MTNSRVFKAVLFSLLFSVCGLSNAKTIEINYPFVLTSSSMEKVSLIHDEEGFHVLQNNEVYSVEKCWIDSSLQDISSEDLQEFLVTGHICVNQLDNGEFTLQAKNLIKGGGPVLAAVGYFGTKAVAYGVMLAGAAGVIGATGGGAVVVTVAGEGLAVAGLATTGTGVVASVIGTSALATEGAVVVTGSILSSGAIGATVVAIEGWALYLGAIGAGIPWF